MIDRFVVVSQSFRKKSHFLDKFSRYIERIDPNDRGVISSIFFLDDQTHGGETMQNGKLRTERMRSDGSGST